MVSYNADMDFYLNPMRLVYLSFLIAIAILVVLTLWGLYSKRFGKPFYFFLSFTALLPIAWVFAVKMTPQPCGIGGCPLIAVSVPFPDLWISVYSISFITAFYAVLAMIVVPIRYFLSLPSRKLLIVSILGLVVSLAIIFITDSLPCDTSPWGCEVVPDGIRSF